MKSKKPADDRQLGFFGFEPPAPAAPEPSEEIDQVEPPSLRLEQNLAILAGAGAGKTYSLVTICLHVLGGARSADPIAPSSLGLLTFTEKAADEMRTRLRQRLELLARGEGEERDLRASFALVKKPFPPAVFWRSVRDALGGATIGTFHSLCTQLLRSAPPRSGVDAAFELLDEREARWLLRDLVERAVLSRIETGSRLRTMVAEIGFNRLVEALVPIATRLREEGVSPDYVPVADGPTLRARFEKSLKALQGLSRVLQPTTARQREQVEEFIVAISRASFDTFERDLTALTAATHNGRGPVKDLRDETEKLSQLYAASLLAPFEAEIRELLVEIARAHEEALSARGVLDFTGLLVQARNVLRDHPDARTEAKKRFGALLVDEFQDTNRLQLELVLLLSENGKSRPLSTAFEQQHQEIIGLPQRRGFLAVVGDRKQSIYEFRGADVSVFEVMARAIERNGGARMYLQHSRRSTPALVEALNRGFAHILRAPESPQDFDVVYEPANDDLRAVRTDDLERPIVQLIDPAIVDGALDAEGRRRLDAEAVARAIRVGLAGDWNARGGDVAILFQRFTQLEVYRQALVRHGIRHRVVRGRGFYGAQEVLDLASFLALLADPSDSISLSAVLRSPLVGLNDSQWVALAQPKFGTKRWGLDAREVIFGADDVESLRLFRQRFRAIHAERDRLSLRAIIRVVLDVFEYRISVAAAPFGEQALANLDKLLALATNRDHRGTGLSEFARELLELADEAPTEAQAEVVDELDLDAVTLCTVHQSKGLEWPIVVLPDLATSPRNETAAVRFDRTLGLGLVRPRGVTDLKSLSAEAITQQLGRRARAEQLRLLYVAMTRARDRVVLGLLPPKAQEKTWANDVPAFFALQVQGQRSDHLDVSRLVMPEGALSLTLSPRGEGIRSQVDRVRAPIQSASAAMVLPVTQLHDFALCPRRFHLAHQVGLLEQGGTLSERLPGEPAEVDARARGTAAHRLLELTPLSAIDDGSLHATLTSMRAKEGLDRIAGEDVLGWVERFFRSDFAGTLKHHEVHRELPFALRVDGNPSLVMRGQIDLLVVTDDSLIVIDYKTSTIPPTGLEPFRFQLSCYALAAQRFVKRKLELRAGVVFLREESPEPRFFDSISLDDVTASLRSETVAIERAQRTNTFIKQPREYCESIGCGFVYRCHFP